MDIIRIQEVCKLSKLSAPTIYNNSKNGTFPKPFKLSKRAIGWSKSEVLNWINSRGGYTTNKEKPFNIYSDISKQIDEELSLDRVEDLTPYKNMFEQVQDMTKSASKKKALKIIKKGGDFALISLGKDPKGLSIEVIRSIEEEPIKLLIVYNICKDFITDLEKYFGKTGEEMEELLDEYQAGFNNG